MTKVQNTLNWLRQPNDRANPGAVIERSVTAHVITIGVCAYALLMGGTFAGITDPAVRSRSMLLLTILGGAWWLERLIRRIPYRVSLMDGIAAAWVAAIGIAWVANGLENRRSGIGAWYDALALLTFLMVADLIRRGLPRRWLVDGILLAGAYTIAAAYQQMWEWLTGWQNVRAAGMPFIPLRPSGTFGNPNSLGTALIVLIMLALPRIWCPNKLIVRIGWGLYVMLAGGLLLLTESKGAWVGLLAGGIALGMFVWRVSDVQFSIRQALKIAGMAAVVGGAVFVFVGMPLLEAGARSDGRLGIYAVAIRAFIERPLTGHGPDSFSLQLMTDQSIPPQPPHAHAHDVPLHVAAELGLGGLLALVFTAIGGLRLYWQTLTHAAHTERPVLIGLGAACIAIAGHGIFDVTATQPALFLLAAAIFAAALSETSLPSAHFIGRGASALLPPRYEVERGNEGVRLSRFAYFFGIALSLFVIIGGWWGEVVYWDYSNGITAAAPGNYHQAAALLDTAATVDPTSPVTWAAAGYIHGLAVLVDKNSLDLPLAIHAYERAVIIESANAIDWLNLAALYAKAGQGDDAIRAATEAAKDAPDDPYFAVNRGLILEQFGHTSEAQAVYAAALKQLPQLSGDLIWQQTDLRRAVAAHYPVMPSRTEQLLALLAAGQIKAAQRQIAQDKAADRLLSEPYVDAALLEIRTSRNIAHDAETIMQNLSVAATLDTPLGSTAWVHEALAELALARGDRAVHDRELAQAAIGDHRGVDGQTIVINGSVPIATYFMSPLPRTLLPTLWYPSVPPDLQRLLADSSTF
ncbi:MAG: O-antigen ligase family protein [Aggregatilineales bacterium]